MMAAGLLEVAARLLDPVTRLVDDLHTSDEERLEARRAVFALQAELFGGLMEYEKGLADARARIIEAEARGQGALQRCWRPVTMLTFLALVVCDAFGWLAFRLAPEAWTLLQIGLGGYVVGRSVEKVAPALFTKGPGNPSP